MDFSMFDDEADDIGQEIEAFCPRCKSDTPHVVVSRYEDEIRRARCTSCEDIHAFRRPRGEEGDEPSEQPVKRKVQKAKPTWEQVMNRKRGTPRLYSGDDVYCELDVITHSVFGVGFVSELVGQNKIEVTFQHDKRILIHNRRLLPLHQVQRQRQEAEARARSDVRARGKELREGTAKAAAAIKVARGVVKAPEPELLDLDLPEELADVLPDVPEPLSMSKATKLSPRALAALEDDDEESEEAEFDEGEAAGARRGRAKRGAASDKADKAEAGASKAARGRSKASDAAAGSREDADFLADEDEELSESSGKPKAARRKADEILAQIKGGADFAELAVGGAGAGSANSSSP